jgi:hypothetical protein
VPFQSSAYAFASRWKKFPRTVFALLSTLEFPLDPSEAAVAFIADWADAVAATEKRASVVRRLQDVNLVKSANSKRTFPSNHSSDEA